MTGLSHIVRFSALFALIGAFLLGGSTAAAAPEVHVFHSRYTMLDATFTVSDGCVTTLVEVGAIASWAQNPGQGAPDSALVITVNLERSTLCPAYELQLDAFSWGTYTGATLVAPTSLTEASLQGAVPMTDSITGAGFDIAVSLYWSCPGPAAPSPYTFQEHESLYTINLHGQVRLNEGCVASGSVTDGTNEFAPVSTSNTFVASGKSGEVDIFR